MTVKMSDIYTVAEVVLTTDEQIQLGRLLLERRVNEAVEFVVKGIERRFTCDRITEAQAEEFCKILYDLLPNPSYTFRRRRLGTLQ